MGYVVNRPRVEGVGEKPTTPKPTLEAGIAINSYEGSKPATDKPTQIPATATQGQKSS